MSRARWRRQGRAEAKRRPPINSHQLYLTRAGNLRQSSPWRLTARLWGQDVFVDVETGVNTAIRKIRQALHDSPEAPVFVETVPGKGYRFIAPVEVFQPRQTRRQRQRPKAPSPFRRRVCRLSLRRVARRWLETGCPSGAHRAVWADRRRRRRWASSTSLSSRRTAAAVSELEFKAAFYRGTWGEAEMRKGIDYYNRAIASTRTRSTPTAAWRRRGPFSPTCTCRRATPCRAPGRRWSRCCGATRRGPTPTSRWA